jgi:hypothetical protein
MLACVPALIDHNFLPRNFDLGASMREDAGSSLVKRWTASSQKPEASSRDTYNGVVGLKCLNFGTNVVDCSVTVSCKHACSVRSSLKFEEKALF